ncbi:MAG: cytochrome C assembly family protein [Burkholderiaceae bacterium]
MPILLHALVAFAYLGVAGAVWRAAVGKAGAPVRPFASGETSYRLSRMLRVVILLAWLLHAWLLRDAALIDGSWRFGFALALSATMWIAVALFWFESLVIELVSIWLLILPLAALCALLPLVFPGSLLLGRMSGADGGAGSAWLPAHLTVALAAYGLLTIAAVHALYMAALERWLHRTGSSARMVVEGANQAAPGDRRGEIERGMLAPLPPLLTMERVLFRLIGAGFALLTLTVATGIVFSESLFGRPMRFDHKTVFTLFAWATFGMLLMGRAMRGWRGRVALSWTLGGFAFLLLAYAGSRFVLEVILHRV